MTWHCETHGPVTPDHYGASYRCPKCTARAVWEEERMKSPCKGICSTTLGDDVCRGCGRTLEEIRDWAAMSDEEREAIMRRVEDE